MTSIVLLGFGNVSFNLIKTLANSSKINVLQVYNRSEIYLGKALDHIAFTTDLHVRIRFVFDYNGLRSNFSINLLTHLTKI